MKTIEEIINSNSLDIVQDEQFLRIPCEKTTIEEGEKIAAKLFRVLSDRRDGYGLAANQIGIQKQVCVVNVKEPIYLINPRIVDKSGSIIFYESCLSFPGKTLRTERYSSITIECDNYDGQLYFNVEDEVDKSINNLNIIEIVALQHEISHLEGKTMFDYEYKQLPFNKQNSYNRNDKVTITNGTDTQVIKYKNFEHYSKKGYIII